MTTDIQPRICCHVNDGCFCISFSNSECLFLTHQEAERLLYHLEETLAHSFLCDDGHVEILDVSLRLGEVVVLREVLATTLGQQPIHKVNWKREGF